MALLDILVGASGGLLQGAQDLRQRQLQDEQRQRQAALDQMQREQFDLQKQQFEDNQAQRALENQRFLAGAELDLLQRAREGLIPDSATMNRIRRAYNLPVEQVTMQLSPLMQAITGINRDQLSADRDYAPGQYGAMRAQQLDDLRAQRAADEQRVAADRQFQLQRDAEARRHAERMAQLQGRLSLQTAQAQRDFAPSFSPVTGQGGQLYAFDQRTGRVNPLGIHAQANGLADARIINLAWDSYFKWLSKDVVLMNDRTPEGERRREAIKAQVFASFGINPDGSKLGSGQPRTPNQPGSLTPQARAFLMLQQDPNFPKN